MTSPFSNLTDTPPAKSQSPFAALTDSAPQEQSLTNWWTNFLGNGLKTKLVDDAMTAEKNGQKIQWTPEDALIKQKLELAQQNGDWRGLAFHDLAHIFTNEAANLAKIPQQVADSKLSDLPSSIMKGILSPITDAAEMYYGVSLTGDDVQTLSPEERAQRVKNTVAMGVMTAVTAGAGAAIGAGTSALVDVGAIAGKGVLATHVAGSITEGAIGGVTYGLTAHANEPNQMKEALTNGIVFGALGPAALLTGVIGKGASDALDAVRKRAGELSQLRQIQDVMEQPLPGNVHQVQALATADNLADAIVKSKITLDKQSVVRISGVSPDAAGKLFTNIPDGFSAALHQTGPVMDVLVHDKKLNLETSFFQQTGHLKNELVSLDGRSEYVVTDGDGKTVDITNRNDPSDKQTVTTDRVRGLPTLQFTFGADPRGNFKVSRLNAETATDALYNEWRNKAFTQGTPQTGDIIGDDPGAPLMRQVTDISQHIDKFLESKRFSKTDVDPLRREFENRLARDAYASSLSDGDRALMQTAHTEYAASQKEANIAALSAKELSVKDLVKFSNTNNFRVSDGGSGLIGIRSADGKIMARFGDTQSAKAFVERVSQANSIELAQARSLSATAASQGHGIPLSDLTPVMPSDWAYEYTNANYRSDAGASERLINGLDNVSFLTPIREFVLNYDTRSSSNHYADIVEPTLSATNARNLTLRSHLERLDAVVKPLQKLSEARRELVGSAMETMSPAEVKARFMSRPMTDYEVSVSDELVRKNIDIEQIDRYRRDFKKLNTEFKDRASDIRQAQQYNIEIHKLDGTYNFDDVSRDMIKKFDDLEKVSRKDVSLGAIKRLARSTIGDGTTSELSREAFYAKHNITPSERGVVNGLDKLYSEWADYAKIDPRTRLGNYMTHARLYTDNNIEHALDEFYGDAKTKDFYARLARTGEITSYERDPIKAAQRYAKAMTDDVTGYNKVVTNATNAVKHIDGPRELQSTLTNYLERVKGYPAAMDTYLQQGVDDIADKLGVPEALKPNLKAWTNGIANLIVTATQGFTPYLGLSHFYMSSAFSIADRSLEYTQRVWSAGAHAYTHLEIMDEVRAAGALTTISPIAQYSAAEYQSAISSKVVKGASEAALKGTLLPTAYEMFSAGHYLTAQADALSALTRFKRGEISWSKLKEETFLDKYDAPIKAAFERKARGNVEEAAKFLGKEAVNDMVGKFDNASSPSGWGTIPGRLLGQFGRWATWYRNSLQRMASRGTVAQRVTSVGKLAAISYATVKTGQKIGLDLSRANVLSSIAFKGGPITEVMSDISDAVRATGYTQQSAARRVQKYLTFKNPKTGQEEFAHMWVPFSFAAQHIYNAIEDIQHGNTASYIEGAESIGVRKFEKR